LINLNSTSFALCSASTKVLNLHLFASTGEYEAAARIAKFIEIPSATKRRLNLSTTPQISMRARPLIMGNAISPPQKIKYDEERGNPRSLLLKKLQHLLQLLQSPHRFPGPELDLGGLQRRVVRLVVESSVGPGSGTIIWQNFEMSQVRRRNMMMKAVTRKVSKERQAAELLNVVKLRQMMKSQIEERQHEGHKDGKVASTNRLRGGLLILQRGNLASLAVTVDEITQRQGQAK
jgi:hypothetical protein